MLKANNEDWCLVSFWSFQLYARVKLASGENFNLHLHLLHPIVPHQSNYKILSTKVSLSFLVQLVVARVQLSAHSHAGMELGDFSLSIKHFDSIAPKQYCSIQLMNVYIF